MATTGARDTKRRGEDAVVDYFEPGVATGAKINQGSMVGLNAAGYAVPASSSTAVRVLGRARKDADNTLGANGAIRVFVERGTFRWANSASGDAITIADVGHDCYVVDDQTVAKTDGGVGRPLAGRVYDVDAGGVYVEAPLGGETLSGTYGPTLAGAANVDGTPTTSGAMFTRIGNIVRVEATLSVDPTAATTPTEVSITLPVASDLAATGDLSGTAVRTGGGVATASGSVEGHAATDTARLKFTSVGTGAEEWHVSFTYVVKS